MKGLNDYWKQWANCQRCPLAKSRKHICHSRGSIHADYILIDTAPSSFDDTQGAPLAGPTGKMLDKILAEVQASIFKDCKYLPQFMITTAVACHPHEPNIETNGQREPTEKEFAACLPRLHEIYKLLKPEGTIFIGDIGKKLYNQIEGPFITIDHPYKILDQQDLNARTPAFWSSVAKIYSFIDRTQQ